MVISSRRFIGHLLIWVLLAPTAAFAQSTFLGCFRQAIDRFSELREQIELVSPNVFSAVKLDTDPNVGWGGSLQERVALLQKKWPENIRFIENAQFALSAGGIRSFMNHRVMAISFSGLTDAQKDEMTQDYTRAMTIGTISFPLKARQGHLVTRLGMKTYDNYNFFSEKDYRRSGHPRLEPVVELTAEEEANLKTYIKNVGENRQGVIGNFKLEGVADRKTNGRLDNNLPTTAGVGHNCTSWLCLAPVGHQGETLASLVGATSGEFHTNPGWWGAYLTSAARMRMPFVVYMEDLPLDQIASKFSADKPFVWDYNLH